MIINIILTISILAIAGIPIIKSIYGTLLFYFVLSLGEFFNIILLSLFNINKNMDSFDPFMKCLLGLPSLIILVLFIIIYKYALKRKEKMNNVYN